MKEELHSHKCIIWCWKNSGRNSTWTNWGIRSSKTSFRKSRAFILIMGKIQIILKPNINLLPKKQRKK